MTERAAALAMRARDKRIASMLVEAKAWSDRRRAAEAAMKTTPDADTARTFLLARADEQEYARANPRWAAMFRQMANSHVYCVAHAHAVQAEEARKAAFTAVTGVPS